MDFLSREAAALVPYTPGEQPQDQPYVKLNTNESPFAPSPQVLEALTEKEILKLNLYSDPTAAILIKAIARRYTLEPENVIAGNGSDEILAFAFRAFCGKERGLAYADITYGFYQAQTAFFGLDASIIPLHDDFSLNVDDYMDFKGTIIIANPNAPTGMTISPKDIRRLLEADKSRVVIVDEAYVDFGAESCVSLIKDFENLLVVQTFSKSRALAGGRIGFALGSPALIAALNRVRYSFHPYNINRLSMLAGVAAIHDEPYFRHCTNTIQGNRIWTVERLQSRGFSVLESKANFVFAKHESVSGEDVYKKLRERGVLVRWFSNERIRDYVRITIGSMEQMNTLMNTLDTILT